jgi:hypothetical protein
MTFGLTGVSPRHQGRIQTAALPGNNRMRRMETLPTEIKVLRVKSGGKERSRRGI